MPTAQDDAARWPQLDLVDRHQQLQRTCRVTAGSLGAALTAAERRAAQAAARLWRRDPAVWSRDPQVQSTIAQRLGWLASPALMADNLDRLRTFVGGVQRDGFTHAVLLGMGGSSLAPEVLRAVLGPGSDGLTLHMLDSTDPAAVLAVDTPVAQTLYVLASKSGTTVEPNSLAAYFKDGLERAGVADWASHFVAITDAGTELAKRAAQDRFRDVFINPSDIGGRYSALSFFGLVPAALMGQRIEALVAWGLALLASSASGGGDGAVALGAVMAAAAQAGRDKLTLLVPPALEPFGLWVEQLVAESTGKQGVGVVPIAGEAPAAPGAYGDDRCFVRLRIAGAPADAAGEALGSALIAAQAPCVELTLPEPEALGAEFARWEIATAVAGALLGINPFDEPNVSQAKDATRALLSQFRLDGRLPMPPADVTTGDGVAFTLTAAAREALGADGPDAILRLLRRRDYFALLAYLGPDPALAHGLHAFRMAVRDATGAATMSGYGPRYLHSTGQLHKGGPNTGVFVLVSALARVDFPIPGEAFSFGTLELAQAIGDFQSLDATGRRALHIHLPEPQLALVDACAASLLRHAAPATT